MAFQCEVRIHDSAGHCRTRLVRVGHESTDFGVPEDPRVVLDGLLGMVLRLAAEHQRWCYEGARFTLGIGEHELPAHAITILHPPVVLTERVRVQRHERGAARRKPVPHSLKRGPGVLVPGRIEVQQERDGRVRCELLARIDQEHLVSLNFQDCREQFARQILLELQKSFHRVVGRTNHVRVGQGVFVEFNTFCRVALEPEVGHDLLHGILLGRFWGGLNEGVNNTGSSIGPPGSAGNGRAGPH